LNFRFSGHARCRRVLLPALIFHTHNEWKLLVLRFVTYSVFICRTAFLEIGGWGDSLAKAQLIFGRNVNRS
jgi:hypothetical protein